VVQGAGVGEDCAAIRLGDEICVLSTDPITASATRLGKLAVLVSLNDVAASGARPLCALLTLLAPPDASPEDIENVAREAAQEARAQGVSIVGGHTEVTDAVRRIVVSSTVVGHAAPGGLVCTGGARPGDALVMSKHAAIEGVAILARDAAARLAGALTPAELAEASAMADAISVLPEGRVGAASGVTAMHDATEGGVLGAAWEMAEASGLGLRVDGDAIAVRPVTRKLCTALGIDPLRLISSGVMLFAHPDGAALCAALAAAGIEAAVIGNLLGPGEARFALFGGRETPLKPPERDEIYSLQDL
ncbi:MAG: hypothetical protein LBU67_07325, partial [Oscillospiraceae bacterium]|jgi:hydrogenase maturation factor|nr:hypothetical protein [Oscillospiraceae bacterium]